MAEYDDILNATWDDIPEAQLLPVGNWLLKGSNVAYLKPKTEEDKAKVLFTYKASKPVNVAEDLLEELGDYDVSINDLQLQIFIESAADWTKVRKQAELGGVDVGNKLFDDSGKLAFAKKFRGSEVVAEVGQRNYTNRDDEVVWQNSISKFQRVTE